MQNAMHAAEAAPSVSSPYATNPSVQSIFDAYLADRANKHAYRRCKHPASLQCALKTCRALWGAMTIEEFRRGARLRVQTQVTAWREKGLSWASARKRCSIMRAAFRYGVKAELIERGQEPVFDLPPNSPPRERFIDPVKELPKLIKEADDVRTPDHTRTAFYMLLICGVRKGALASLQWRHVDFENRVILFRETEAPEERSKKRRANQPMNDFLYRLLSEAKERARSDYVIEWRGDGAANTYHSLKRLFKRAGCPDLRVHDLRRSSATFVYNGLNGNLSAAARHLADTEKMAESTYVQKDIAKNLPGIDAVTSTILQAKAAA